MIYTKLKEWLPHDLYVEYVDIIKEKVQCPHCGIMCAANMAKRWHFDNCKSGQVQQGD